MSALVSVLIPVFNAASFIYDTLESVLVQSYPNLEIIVVDDGSTDGSSSIIKELNNPKIKLLRQSNSGQPSAFNLALKHAKGQYIQYLDADDLIGPDKIRFQVERLELQSSCIASAEWGRFHQDASTIRWNPEPCWSDLDPLDWLAESRADGGGMMFPALWLLPRSLVEQIGPWREEFGTAQTPETEYFTRAVLASKRVLFCTGSRCYYRSGFPGTVSKRKNLTAWRTQFEVIHTCEQAVCQSEDSDRIRQGFALSWQQFAFGCYPYDSNLADRALEHARALSPVEILPGGGPTFHLTTKLLGWRLARRLQVWSGRP